MLDEMEGNKRGGGNKKKLKKNLFRFIFWCVYYYYGFHARPIFKKEGFFLFFILIFTYSIARHHPRPHSPRRRARRFENVGRLLG